MKTELLVIENYKLEPLSVQSMINTEGGGVINRNSSAYKIGENVRKGVDDTLLIISAYAAYLKYVAVL